MMRFARLARKFEQLQFGHRFLSNWMNCLGVIVQSVLKDFYLEDSNEQSTRPDHRLRFKILDYQLVINKTFFHKYHIF